VTGMADNVLKPLMLGRGVDAPMPVVLFGALGGMASGGILGMFVGATLLALGSQNFYGLDRHQSELGSSSSTIQETGLGNVGCSDRDRGISLYYFPSVTENLVNKSAVPR
jgi:hypothetical protein